MTTSQYLSQIKRKFLNGLSLLDCRTGGNEVQQWAVNSAGAGDGEALALSALGCPVLAVWAVNTH